LSRISRSWGSGLVVGFVCGVVIAAAAVLAYSLLISEQDPVSEARSVIEQNYFKAVPDSVLDNASVNGMIDEVKKRYDDRFSHYFNPHQLREFDHSTSGHFSGVGLTVTGVKRGLRVASVLPHSPAQAADLREGDVIIAVDGHSIAGIPEQVAVAKIKGPPGTPVTLRVASAGSPKARDVHLRRAQVQVPAVSGQIKQAGGTKAAYVHYATFSQGSHGELSTTLERLYRQGAKGLVLDLRGNGGGLLNEAVLVASIFIPDGTIVSTSGRARAQHTYRAVGTAISTKVPVVVLVDHGTASAAEIVTGALQDRHRAEVVGTRTFGKGVFQEIEQLSNGGALDITVGEYFLPSGRNLGGGGVKEGRGIAPDVTARDNPHTSRDEALDAALRMLAAQRR
jgi:carboxyl-terminal processing protease